MFLVPALLFPRAVGEKAKNFLRLNNRTPYFSWPVAIAIVLAALPAVSWLYQLNQGMRFPAEWKDFEDSIRLMEEEAGKLVKVFLKAADINILLVNILVVAAIPAVCEEFFFRGALQNLVKRCFNNEAIAIIFTAIVFSGIHGQFYGFLPRLFLGIVLGYIYSTSGNIWVSVLAHFVHNALMAVAVYVNGLYPEMVIFNDDYEFPFYVSMMSLAMVIGLIWWHKKLFKDLVFREIGSDGTHQKMNNPA